MRAGGAVAGVEDAGKAGRGDRRSTGKRTVSKPGRCVGSTASGRACWCTTSRSSPANQQKKHHSTWVLKRCQKGTMQVTDGKNLMHRFCSDISFIMLSTATSMLVPLACLWHFSLAVSIKPEQFQTLSFFFFKSLLLKFTLTMTPTSPKTFAVFNLPTRDPNRPADTNPPWLLLSSQRIPEQFLTGRSVDFCFSALSFCHTVVPNNMRVSRMWHMHAHIYKRAYPNFLSVFREKQSSLTMAPSCGVCQLITLKWVTSVYFRKKMTPSQGILVLRNYVEVSWRVSFWGKKCFEIILKDVCLKNYSIYTWAVI